MADGDAAVSANRDVFRSEPDGMGDSRVGSEEAERRKVLDWAFAVMRAQEVRLNS
jgi:hypothetical protein